MKICRICNLEKPLTRFSIRNKDTGLLRTECKDCLNIARTKQPRYRVWHRENKQRVKDYMKNYDLGRTYGSDIKEYNRLLTVQNDSCAICNSKEAKGKGHFHVDHCHLTGKIRGLLCHNCNVGIGHFNDDTQKLLNAIKYLEGSPWKKIS